jgi:hypothetical protein
MKYEIVNMDEIKIYLMVIVGMIIVGRLIPNVSDLVDWLGDWITREK